MQEVIQNIQVRAEHMSRDLSTTWNKRNRPAKTVVVVVVVVFIGKLKPPPLAGGRRGVKAKDLSRNSSCA